MPKCNKNLDSNKKWTKGQLCQFLEDEAKLYLKDVQESIIRNKHMHEFKGKKIDIKLVEAVLVGYINNIASGQGMDLGLYTHYLHED